MTAPALHPDDRRIATAIANTSLATARRILRDVADRHGLRPDDLTGPRRLAPLVRARWEAIDLIATTFPGWSNCRIGRFMGRDHTSVIHALKKRGAYPRRRVS